ncbi:DUF4192 domain-containing protein [Antribacter gilvus]|uniref:DUF4192 domain-containing protein n=1 Tax=Antribacter gilvus TaxID=2304675 RepID=UPI000F7AC90E|nr:DUF4192 domain-containing protein [Antribacter gilvus]
MNASTKVRIVDDADCLAAIASRLRYRPTDSMVIACVRPDRTLGLVARVDLADVNPKSAAWLATKAQEDHATHVVVVLYSEDTTNVLVCHDLITEALEIRGIPVACAYQVTPTRYRLLGQPGVRWVPITEVAESRAALTFHLNGRHVAEKREDLLPRPAAPHKRAKATAAFERYRAEYPRTAEPDTRLAVWNAAVHTVPDDAPTLGRLAAMLTDKDVRDALFVAMIPGSPADLPARMLANPNNPADHGAVGEAMARLTIPSRAVRPDKTTQATANLLAQIIAHAPAEHSANAWALLGVLLWWQGEPIAGDALQHALAIEPDHTLASTLLDAVVQGFPPAWVRAEQNKFQD